MHWIYIKILAFIFIMLNKNLSCSVIQNILCIKFKLKYKLPQLVPFFFLNQVIFAFALLVILIYAFSKYILPKFVALFISRISITKL